MTTAAFLHTSPVHLPTFEALTAELVSGAGVVSIVDVDLLDRARSHGTDDPQLADGVLRALEALAGGGATTIVCTCSTIGGLAERIGRERSLPVVRVDRPMAERAVEIGGRILVVAALASTVAPTTALLDEVAAGRGIYAHVEVLLVVDAWRHFESGDLDAYHRTITDAVVAATRRAASPDVIVLAQASMAPVADADEVVALAVPVLASPRTAVQSLRPR
jgi:aspartate/glutamate racemase